MKKINLAISGCMGRMGQQLIKSSKKNIALVSKYHSGMDGTVVKIGSKNKITEVIPPHLQDSDFSFSDKFKTLNIYKFSQDFTNNIFSKLLWVVDIVKIFFTPISVDLLMIFLISV